MKRAGIVCVALVMPLLVGFKQEDVQKYSQVTSSPKIMNALDLMDGTSGEWSKKAILGDNLSKKPIKVSFKNLGTLSPAYKDFDALGWKAGDQLYIYINERHMGAPPEAVGSLLSHEAVHQDEYSSIEEETYCWGYEANVWQQMQKRNPKLKQIGYKEFPLVDRLNTLTKMFVNANYTTRKIYQEVSTNPGYSNLPLFSPGFDKKIMAVKTGQTGDLPSHYTPTDYGK